MRLLLLSIYLCCGSFSLCGQQLSVVSFRKTDRIDARTHAKRDNNGEMCALIKIATHIEGLSFDVGAYGITALDYKNGEYWLYISPTEQRLEIWGDHYAKIKYRFPISIDSDVTYDMKLRLEQPEAQKATGLMDFLSRGIAKANLRDYHGAIFDFSRAIAIDPDDPTPYRHRGFAKALLRDYAGAKADFTDAIECYARDVESYRGRGFAHKKMEDYPAAYRDGKQALQLYRQQGNTVKAGKIQRWLDDLPAMQDSLHDLHQQSPVHFDTAHSRETDTILFN